MMNVAPISRVATALIPALLLAACDGPAETGSASPQPKAIIDLGIAVTENTTEELWGEAMLNGGGFDRGHSFEVIEWTYRDIVNGSNSYYTFFNHGGPHVDAPNHIGLIGGLETFSAEAFVGPVKAIDAREFGAGDTIPIDLFENAGIKAGDVVLIYTGYEPAEGPTQIPLITTLTPEAADFLANLSVRAFGTDALSLHSPQAPTREDASDSIANAVPIHHAFLSRGIPVYELMQNVDQVLEVENGLFVGQPLEVVDGDGMLVRPYVLVF